MEMTYLLKRHPLSLIASETAPSAEARFAHRGLAAGYAIRIASLRRSPGFIKLIAVD